MDEFNLDNTGKYDQTRARKKDAQFEIEPRRSPRREPEAPQGKPDPLSSKIQRIERSEG